MGLERGGELHGVLVAELGVSLLDSVPHVGEAVAPRLLASREGLGLCGGGLGLGCGLRLGCGLGSSQDGLEAVEEVHCQLHLLSWRDVLREGV